MFIILSPDLPSHNSGICPVFQLLLKTVAIAFLIFFSSVPTITFVPISTVSGLSVFSLMVMQGMFNTVVYSVIPPESVITHLAFATKKLNSK